MCVVAGLAALTCLAFARIWTLPFVYDDFGWLMETPTFRAGLAVSGGLPWGPHGMVLALHLLNGVLLWWLVRRSLSSVGALVTLTLFWLHPLPAQAVAYVTGGREVLLTTYVLIAALGAVSGRWWGALVALVALSAAVTLKASAAPLLVVAPLVWTAWYGWSRVMALTLGIVGLSVTGTGLLSADHEAVQTWAVALWRYLAYVPVPSGFSVIHDWTAVPLPVAGMCVALTVSAGLLAWLSRRPTPWWAWVWVVGLTGPRALIPQAPSLTEWQMYLPAVAIWIALGSAVDNFNTESVYG